MACYYPLKAYKSLTPGEGVTFKRTSHSGEAIELACGQCIGCRIQRANDWAARLCHEASLHDANMFITLTYADEHLPEAGTLVKKHFQDFMKRYRSAIEPKKIRFFHCGEYGGKTLRPHYHALIFGHRFDDLQLHSRNKQGDPLFTSAKLETLWGLGHCLIGEVTYKSANYTARYLMKRVNGDLAETHYQRVDPETGEVHNVLPEYATMSNRPGIGYNWLQRYASDIFPHDHLVIDGRKQPVPRYYWRKWKEENEQASKPLQRKRIKAAKRQTAKGENSHGRLVARETCKKAKLAQAKRETI